MKVFIGDIKGIESKLGGGWSFTRNFIDLVDDKLVNTLDEADIFFITGATLVTRDEFRQAKAKKKKIVLRADGIPEDWRNRGTGWSRFRDYSLQADLVIYQSDFIHNTIGKYMRDMHGLKAKQVIIYNGVDTTIFNPHGDKFRQFGDPSVLYVNYRKNENNKRVEEAIERFRYFKVDNPNATMTFAGNFSKEQFLWNGSEWDFGMLDMRNTKDWQYVGIISDRSKLAKIMRSADFLAFPSFADPCPNTLIEGLMCGLEPLWVNEYGGQHDIVKLWENKFDFSREHMVANYISEFEQL